MSTELLREAIPQDILKYLTQEERDGRIFPFFSRSYDYRFLTAFALAFFLILFVLDYFVFTGLEAAYAVTFAVALCFFFIAFFTAKKVGCYATNKRLVRREKSWFGEDYKNLPYGDIVSIEYTARPSLPFLIISWFYFLMGWLIFSALREPAAAYLLFASAGFFLLLAFFYKERLFHFYAPGISVKKWTMRFEKLSSLWCLEFVAFIKERLPNGQKTQGQL